MLHWMHWTVPSAIGLGVIVLAVVAVNVIGILRPGMPRKGFMPMVTTRGDRLFMSFIGSFLIFLFWMGLLPGVHIAFSFFVVVPYFVVMMWRG